MEQLVDVCIIGAGAAGLVAAGSAGTLGAGVQVLERNRVPGRKLAITGKGRCNVTNTADPDEFMRNLPGNGQFLFSSLAQLSPQETMELFTELGVRLKVERGGRVFPESDDAKEVVDALVGYARKGGAAINYDTRIKSVEALDGGGLLLQPQSGGSLSCKALILATGGVSYPGTGSTGDGYGFAEALGHTIVKPSPALVPIESDAAWVKEVQGLSLKNVEASIHRDGKLLQSEFGEMLFTHFGVSGPLILTLSRKLTEDGRKGKGNGGTYLMIDLKPALSEEQLDERVQRDFSNRMNKLFRNSLDELLPRLLIPPIIELSGIPGDKPVNQVTREERLRLVVLLKGLKVPLTKARPLNEAIITAGGISVKEVNPKTMGSKKVPGLYFAGEVLDVDGYTGGFNLQAAWSTGFVAGKSAAVHALES